MQKKVQNNTFYSVNVFMPNDLINDLNNDKMDINVDQETPGQAGSLFNNMFVETNKNGKTMKVRPRIKGNRLPLASAVRSADPDVQFKRQNLDKITLDVEENSTYVYVDKDTKTRTIQNYGEAMQLYSAKFVERLKVYNSQKKLMHPVKKVYTAHKTHFESKDDYDDDGNAKLIERNTRVISHTLEFDKNTHLPKCKVLDLQGNPLTMEIADDNDNVKKVSFTAHTAHLFLGKGSEITFTADISSMSRTSSGKGFAAKMVDVYIKPKPYVAAGVDEDDLAIARGEFDEEEPNTEKGGFADNMAGKLN